MTAAISEKYHWVIVEENCTAVIWRDNNKHKKYLKMELVCNNYCVVKQLIWTETYIGASQFSSSIWSCLAALFRATLGLLYQLRNIPSQFKRHTYNHLFAREYVKSGTTFKRPDCLLIGLFRRRSTKLSKFCVTGLCEGNPPVTGGLGLGHETMVSAVCLSIFLSISKVIVDFDNGLPHIQHQAIIQNIRSNQRVFPHDPSL